MAKVLPLEAFTLGIQMLPCTHNLCYLIVLQGSKSRLVGWVLVCNCFWLCLKFWRQWACTVFTQGKWQPWLFNGSSRNCEVSRKISGRIIRRLPRTVGRVGKGWVCVSEACGALNSMRVCRMTQNVLLGLQKLWKWSACGKKASSFSCYRKWSGVGECLHCTVRL